MGQKKHQRDRRGEVWAIAKRQHGVVSRAQLLDFGFQTDAIQHRIATGRLHPIVRGVYAVGRPEVTQYGKWMAAILCCGPGAALSHFAAGGLLGIRPSSAIEVSIPMSAPRRRPGITVHRRPGLSPDEVTTHRGIPVTTPACTLVDFAIRLTPAELDRAINEADRLDLIHPDELRAALEGMSRRPGLAVARAALDRNTFTLNRSELERRFFALVRAAGLPRPMTLERVNGFEVDFYWPDLGLVVEADSLRHHRTPAQQTQDRFRDQVHAAAGLTTLRFSHWQVRYRPAHVRATLEAVVGRLAAR